MMQIELIGCTGAGKSTLAASIVAVAQRASIQLVRGDDVVLRRLGLSQVSSPSLRVGLIHWATLTECLRHVREHSEFLSAARQSLAATRIRRRTKCNQLRKVLKQWGRLELIRRVESRLGAALVDEGTLQSAHNLFVHVGHRFDSADLRRFAECVPLPDVAVYVRSPENELIERTLRRGHPRIVPTRPAVSSFVRQAVRAFDQLTTHKRIAARTVVIEDARIRVPDGSTAPWMRMVVDLLGSAIEAQATASCGSSPACLTNRSIATM